MISKPPLEQIQQFVKGLVQQHASITGAFIGGATAFNQVFKPWQDVDIRLVLDHHITEIQFPKLYEGILFDISFHVKHDLKDHDKLLMHPTLSELALAHIIYDPTGLLALQKEKMQAHYQKYKYKLERAKSLMPMSQQYYHALQKALTEGKLQGIRDHCGVWLHYLSQTLTLLGGERPTMRMQLIRLRKATTRIGREDLYSKIEATICPITPNIEEVQYWKDKALFYYDLAIAHWNKTSPWQGMDTVIPEKRDYWFHGIQELIEEKEYPCALLAIQIVLFGLRPIFVNERNHNKTIIASEFSAEWEEFWSWLGYPLAHAERYFKQIEQIYEELYNLINS